MQACFDPMKVYVACNKVIRHRRFIRLGGRAGGGPAMHLKLGDGTAVLVGNPAALPGRLATTVPPELVTNMDRVALSGRKGADIRRYTWEICAKRLKKRAGRLLGEPRKWLVLYDSGYELYLGTRLVEEVPRQEN